MRYDCGYAVPREPPLPWTLQPEVSRWVEANRERRELLFWSHEGLPRLRLPMVMRRARAAAQAAKR